MISYKSFSCQYRWNRSGYWRRGQMVNYIRAWMILNQKKCWPTSVERGGQMNCSPCSDYRGLAGLGWAGWAGWAGRETRADITHLINGSNTNTTTLHPLHTALGTLELATNLRKDFTITEKAPTLLVKLGCRMQKQRSWGTDRLVSLGS